jgi:hypothetical protein
VATGGKARILDHAHRVEGARGERVSAVRLLGQQQRRALGRVGG